MQCYIIPFVVLCGILLAAHHAVAEDAETGRDFPEGLTMDEPGIDDVALLPQLTTQTHGEPAVRETDVNLGLEKRLTDQLGMTIGNAYTVQRGAGMGDAAGWQNLDVNLKYNFLNDDAHEWVASVGVTHEFGATGAVRIGADRHGATTPAFDLGKGMGDSALPWLRPLALTANIAVQIPDQASRQSPYQATLAASVQYDLAYLQPEASEAGRAHVMGRFTPLVELVTTTAASPTDHAAPETTLTPAIAYHQGNVQIAAATLVPLTKTVGSHIGGLLQLNLFFSGPWSEPIFKNL